MDERRLVDGCKQHDRTAQSELYGCYVGRLRAVCLRYVSDEDDAEDLLHDVFLKVFGSISSFRWKGEGSLWRWMKQVAVSLAVDNLRRSQRLQLMPLNEEAYEEIAEPEAADVAQLTEETLLRFVTELPVGYRTVFNMVCIEGMNHRQVARTLGIAEKSSSSQLARARVMLARKIHDYLRSES